jgi:hypothetical protein
MLRSLQARQASSSGSSGLTQKALEATTYLAQESTLASKGDPVAANAFKVLNAMSASDSEFAKMQARATAGDPTAAQEMIIREADIVRAAAGSGKP